MAAKQRLGQIRSQLGKLGRDSLDVVANANRIVYQGIQKLAEQELKALNEYYKNAVGNLKSARGGDGTLKDVAISQLDLMQETVNRVIGHARESLSVLAETRAELARLVEREPGTVTEKALSKVAVPAQKAIEDVRKAAAKAQKSAAKTADDVRRALEKEMAAAEKKGKETLKNGRAKAEAVGLVVKQKIGSVLDIAPPAAAPKKAVQAKPSPESRANRATSKAKRKPAHH